MQGGRHVCYHSKIFDGVVLNYPTYGKELYALVQAVKKWKHYLIGKETIIHTDHQSLVITITIFRSGSKFRKFSEMLYHCGSMIVWGTELYPAAYRQI
jgi:Ni,Fe-hydrogenase I cytochrome b subunit